MEEKFGNMKITGPVEEEHLINKGIITLNRFLTHLVRDPQPIVTYSLLQLLFSILSTIRCTSSLLLRREGIELPGKGLAKTAEEQNWVNTINELFRTLLATSCSVAGIISGPEPHLTIINSDGEYLVSFIALDNPHSFPDPCGSLFAVYTSPKEPLTEVTGLNKLGRNLICSGYALYGATASLVFGVVNKGVHQFVLDSVVGDFLLSEAHISIPAVGYYCCVNEAQEPKFDPPTREFLRRFKQKRLIETNQTRCLGAVVPEVHMILRHGGIAMYPGLEGESIDGTQPLVTTGFPLAHLVREAGGLAITSGAISVLGLSLSSLGQKAPLYLGSKENLADFFETFIIYRALRFNLPSQNK